MVWHLAPSLARLRAELNERWPDRDKTSDGSIGDAAHSALVSDHNPNARSSVNAVDIDKDGIDVAELIAAAERHPSVHYWIFNRQIADRDGGFRRQAYSGPNPHDKHVHISIRQSATAENDTRPWGLLEDDMDAGQMLDALSTERGQAVLARAAGIGAHNQQLGRSGVTMGVALQSLLHSAGLEAAEVPPTARENAQAVLDALGGHSPTEVAASLRQVPGVDWFAVGRVLAQ